MFVRILGVAFLACAAMAQSPAVIKERRQQLDESWAKRSGLSVADVHAVRLLAGITDESLDGVISQITTIKLRNQILLAEGGKGHCTWVHVFERENTGFKEVWTLREAPSASGLPGREDRPGRGICTQAPRPPTIKPTPEGDIVVEVPSLMDPFERSVPVSTYKFAWDGTTYKLVESER